VDNRLQSVRTASKSPLTFCIIDTEECFSLNFLILSQDTHIAVFSRSAGVTATIDSTQPATIPAKIPRAGDNRPCSSANRFRTESNDKKRTPALKVVPTTNVEHPAYIDPMPSDRAVWVMSEIGFDMFKLAPLSCALVFANSNGYYFRQFRCTIPGDGCSAYCDGGLYTSSYSASKQ
jgi:hypothetical protein